MIEFLSNHSLLFYTTLAVAIFLTRIPVAGKYFRSVNTMIHEAGHAFMTMVLSGEVIAVNLFADTSGNTVTKAKNKISQVLIAAAGYPLSSLAAFVLLFLLSKGYELYILFIFASLTLLLMVFSIRNGYGLFWAGTFSVINLLLIYFNQPTAIYLAASFFSLIVLTDSVFSAIILFVLTIKSPQKAGDATNLHKFTKIPALIWSVLFLLIAALIVYYCILFFFPSPGEIFS